MPGSGPLCVDAQRTNVELRKSHASFLGHVVLPSDFAKTRKFTRDVPPPGRVFGLPDTEPSGWLFASGRAASCGR